MMAKLSKEQLRHIIDSYKEMLTDVEKEEREQQDKELQALGESAEGKFFAEIDDRYESYYSFEKLNESRRCVIVYMYADDNSMPSIYRTTYDAREVGTYLRDGAVEITKEQFIAGFNKAVSILGGSSIV
jgi:bisphosphoglycerate-dependent phosphoglycerate mutase